MPVSRQALCWVVGAGSLHAALPGVCSGLAPGGAALVHSDPELSPIGISPLSSEPD